MEIVTNVAGVFTLGNGAPWNFWFYPNGGQWSALNSIDWDPRVMHLVTRAYDPLDWSIEGDEVTVLFEWNIQNSQGRHVYAVLVKNSHQIFSKSFFIAACELVP